MNEGTAESGGQRKSIVHLMGWHSQQYGSFERFLVSLSHLCEEAGAETHLVFPRLPPSAAFRADVRASIHLIPLMTSPADVRPAATLRRLLVEVGATHVHAHFGLDAYMALAVARTTRVPRRFATKHATPGTSRRTLARMRHRWLARQAEVVFAVSQSVYDDLVALGIPPRRLQVTRLGVDVEAYRPDAARRAAARAMLGVGAHDRVILCTSHLRPGKGVELLPALMSSLTQLDNPVTLLVAGDGPLRDFLERAAKSHGLTSEQFRLMGVREDVPELLAAADLYVFPTTGDEGLPLGPVEALASGVPVVASAVSDLGELLGNGAAVLVPRGDSSALADACRGLLLDPDRAAEMGRRGRALAMSRLDVRAASEQHVRRYFSRTGATTARDG